MALLKEVLEMLEERHHAQEEWKSRIIEKLHCKYPYIWIRIFIS